MVGLFSLTEVGPMPGFGATLSPEGGWPTSRPGRIANSIESSCKAVYRLKRIGSRVCVKEQAPVIHTATADVVTTFAR